MPSVSTLGAGLGFQSALPLWAENAIITDIMAQVIIRNLDAKTVALLKARAKRNGRSLEAELRSTLAQSVAADDGDAFMAWVREHRGPKTPGLDIVEVIRSGREERTKAILDAALGSDR
jgi:plasmid stability protein